MKLKKSIAICLLVTIFVLQFNLLSISYAAGNNSSRFSTMFQMVQEKVLHPADEFEVNVKIADFQNIEKGLISLSGQLEYDTNVLEMLKITEESQWSEITINEENLKFVTDANDYVTNGGNVFTIKFKVKDTINKPIETTIKIKNILASNGIIDIESADAQIEINIENRPDSITSNKYVIEEGLISRIPPKTTVNTFKQNVEAVGDLVFTDKAGNVLGDNDMIATNMKLQVGDTLQFTLIVIGDIDEDGMIGLTDLAELKLHYIGKTLLTGTKLKAVDIDGSGEMTITDLAQMKLVLIGKKEIK